MGFVGAINADLRAVLAELAPRWRDRKVYVGCSGNFTVERILHQAGAGPDHPVALECPETRYLKVVILEVR